MIKDWEDQLTFGLHKDYTVLEVVYFLENADYIVWLIENTSRTDFSVDILQAIYLAQADQWLALMFEDLQNIMTDVLHTRRTNDRRAGATG